MLKLALGLRWGRFFAPFAPPQETYFRPQCIVSSVECTNCLGFLAQGAFHVPKRAHPTHCVSAITLLPIRTAFSAFVNSREKFCKQILI